VTFARDQYDIIILNESFAGGRITVGSSIENNDILKFFQNMHMVTRRHILLVLVGKNLKTLDNMAAFFAKVSILPSINRT